LLSGYGGLSYLLLSVEWNLLAKADPGLVASAASHEELSRDWKLSCLFGGKRLLKTFLLAYKRLCKKLLKRLSSFINRIGHV
jgi:hypothetical protein